LSVLVIASVSFSIKLQVQHSPTYGPQSLWTFPGLA